MATTGTSRFAYEQVAESLRAEIMMERLKPGDRLPPIRQLASHYKVSAVTAQNALAHLQEQGLIRSGSTRGYFVSDDAGSALADSHGQNLAEELSAVREALDRLTKRVDELEGVVRDGASLESSPIR